MSADFSSSEELANYKATRVPPACTNPPSSGKIQRTCTLRLFPVMSATARRMMCVNVCSVQSERDFLSVRRTVTDMPSRRNEDTVEAVKTSALGKRAELISC